jgi:hypothetical protein
MLVTIKARETGKTGAWIGYPSCRESPAGLPDFFYTAKAGARWPSVPRHCYISFRGNSMTLAEQIQTDIVVAMKARDDFKLSVLRMVKSAIQLKEVEKLRKLDDAESIQLLQTILKQRRESIDQFSKGNRPELAEKETKEAAIIEKYLPAGASTEEMNAAIDKAIAETAANSIKQMGAVVKAAKSALEGKTVDGKALSDLVRERLAKLG